MKTKILPVIIAAFLFLFTVSFSSAQVREDAQVPAQQMQEIQVQTQLGRMLLDNQETTIMGRLFVQTGIDKTLSQDGPYTLFVPTNQSLMNVPQDIAQRAVTDKATAERVLRNHVVNGRITNLTTTDKEYDSLNGMKIKITSENSDYYVNGQKIVDMKRYEDGIVYVIDGTIMPEDVVRG